jgi:ribose 5-phosphate isomerase B
MIYIASDHAGFELKEHMKKILKEMKMDYEDIGPYKFNSMDDYPDFIIPAAKKVSENTANRGVVIGGSGQGEAIAANKVTDIRAVVYYGKNIEIIKLSRLHNDSNILSLGARFLTKDEATDALKVWLSTEFEGGRHQKRIDKIKSFERDE